ncbi:outer membrane protein assembly factor BamB family protein [Halorussus halophilus]|uniref:outer membrane protein assembly factor BamB family protein n=1 Tax=Halorussus halophilus TaxID=2650975 RepID=UPI0013012BA5|nr:PQQ-binding-like beta-propeller repeat protein [Halorussus halophilus]
MTDRRSILKALGATAATASLGVGVSATSDDSTSDGATTDGTTSDASQKQSYDWRTDPPGEGYPYTTRVYDQRIFAASGDTVSRLNIESGDVEWETQVSEDVSFHDVAVNVEVGQQSAIIAAADGVVYAFDRIEGTQKWKAQLDWEHGTTGVAPHSGHMFVGSHDADGNGAMYCLDTDDGHVVWKSTGTCGDSYATLTTPLADGDVYFGSNTPDSENATLYALDSSSAERKWSKTGYPVFSMATDEGTETLYVGLFAEADETVVALDGDDGTVRWSQDTVGEYPEYEMTVDHLTEVDGDLYGVAYRGGADAPTDQKLFSLSAQNEGTVRWRTDVDDGDGALTTPVLYTSQDSKTCYVASSDSKAYRVDPSTGNVVRTIDTDGPVVDQTPVTDDRLFVGTPDGNVTAYLRGTE